jgi:hypothetical protein
LKNQTTFPLKQVEPFYYTKYGDPTNAKDHQYTKEIKLRYSKPGTANPTVRLFVKDLTSNHSEEELEVLPPKEFIQRFGKDFILFRTYWITNEKLGAVWMNRFQNASSTSGKKSCQLI